MTLIRLAFTADAVATAATGLLLAVGGEVLAGLTGLPAAFTMPVGWLLVLFALFVGWIGTRRPVPLGLGTLVVWVNAAWVVASVVVLLVGTFPLTLIGVAFVLAQAVAVALLGALQWHGLAHDRAFA